MSIFTRENIENYRKHKEYYYQKYIKRLEPFIKRFPIIMKLSYIIQSCTWFGLPIFLIMVFSKKAREEFSWKVLGVYYLLFLPAGWGWNFYAAAYTHTWVFLEPLFTGIEIKGMTLGDIFFYIAGIPCFYVCYLFADIQCKKVSPENFLKKYQKVLSYVWTAVIVAIGLIGWFNFAGAGKSICIFMYGPVFLLLLFYHGKLPIPEVLIMTAIGMFLEFSWDKFATTYGFWVYEKNFIGLNVWGTVPIEMLYFSFPSGTSVVLVTTAIKKVLKIK